MSVGDPSDFHGRKLQEGDRVFAIVNAANRDGRAFADPDRFDITRPRNRHLTFGFGVHFCLGAPLARLEGRICIAEPLRRYRRIELAVDPDRLYWLDGLIMRGVKALPLRLEPA